MDRDQPVLRCLTCEYEERPQGLLDGRRFPSTSTGFVRENQRHDLLTVNIREQPQE
jgi:hypothetical protein